MTATTDGVDVYITGTGMVGYRQLTREATAALEKAERVYLVHAQKSMKNHLEEFCDEVVPLTEEYTEGENRRHAYARMAEQVMEGAEQATDPVVLALYGHPMVFVSPSRLVVEEAPERGLNVEVQPGISSMDCIYADLALDPAESGIQMFEASALLLREYELNPDVPAMIWQIGMVESALHSTADSEPARFRRIREYLEQSYPADHTVYLVQTATYPITDSKRIGFELGEFESMADQINSVQTLYVPAVRDRPVQNEKLAELFRSQDHIETVTKDV